MTRVVHVRWAAHRERQDEPLPTEEALWLQTSSLAAALTPRGPPGSAVQGGPSEVILTSAPPSEHMGAGLYYADDLTSLPHLLPTGAQDLPRGGRKLPEGAD